VPGGSAPTTTFVDHAFGRINRSMAGWSATDARTCTAMPRRDGEPWSRFEAKMSGMLALSHSRGSHHLEKAYRSRSVSNSLWRWSNDQRY
jgi:hypothetical protein